MFTGPDGLTVGLRNGALIYFGDTARPHAKWIAAARVLADPGSSGASYVDVRVPDRPAAGGIAGANAAQSGQVSAIDPTATALAANLALQMTGAPAPSAGALGTPSAALGTPSAALGTPSAALGTPSAAPSAGRPAGRPRPRRLAARPAPRPVGHRASRRAGLPAARGAGRRARQPAGLDAELGGSVAGFVGRHAGRRAGLVVRGRGIPAAPAGYLNVNWRLMLSEAADLNHGSRVPAFATYLATVDFR